MASYKLGCLIMAAGNASRFHANKLTAQFGGKSLIRRAFEAIPTEAFTRVAVVTQYAEIAALAEQFGFLVVENGHPEYGISYTIRLGVEALTDCDGILFAVADQPLLRADSLRRLIDAWRAAPEHIVGASCGGKRGNPNIFPREFFPALSSLQGDTGGSVIIRAHPHRLLTVEVAPEELTDVDTPAALADLIRKAD